MSSSRVTGKPEVMPREELPTTLQPHGPRQVKLDFKIDAERLASRT